MGQIACPVQSWQSKVWAGQCHPGEIIGAKLLQNVKNMFCKKMNISKLFRSALGLFPHHCTCIIAVKKVEANDRNIFLIPLNADHRLGSASHGLLKTYKCDMPCNKNGVLFLIWPILSFQKIKKEKTKIWFI